MEAFKNRQEHLLSGALVPTFLQGMDRMTWRSLTALGSVYSMVTVISFILPVGLFLCKSKTSGGNISLDFRASPSETELREGIRLLPLLPSWDGLAFPPSAPAACMSCAQDRTLCIPASYTHSTWATPYVTLSLQANSSLLHLLCSFQPPLWPQLLRL